MQELSDSIKRPNLRIMGIEEGEEVQAKVHTIYLIITENFPNLKKDFLIKVQKLPRPQTDLTKIEPLHGNKARRRNKQHTNR
jgi:hypothetical protein